MISNVRRIALAANAVAVLLALVLVWQPEIQAYWIPRHSIGDRQLELARQHPADSVLDEVGRQRFGLPDKPSELDGAAQRDIVHRANELMKGKAALSNIEPVEVAFPFTAENLSVGPPPFLLDVAGLGTVDLLVSAYRATGQRTYLDAAAKELKAFRRVDRTSLVPRGLLWNDHALANRMSILAEVWLLVRGEQDLDRELAEDLLNLAATTAARLAKPVLFTYRTNHGVMQNLALLQYAAAFPALPDAQSMKAIGCERLLEQLRYYVSAEGVVLEHSAGYHEFGRDLLESGVRLAALTGCRAESVLENELRRVQAVSALLRRPDGSLPVYGNTDYVPRFDVPTSITSRPKDSSALLPASGLAVWWTGLEAWPEQASLSQTVVTWSFYPTRAHKHADDMSVVVWSGGRPWIGGSGYWPYSTRSYDAAQGWRSSNAPHFVGESARSRRTTHLLGTAEAKRVRAIDLERRLDDGSRVRRRMVELDGTTWLIADSVTSDRPAPVERLWTLPPAAELQSIGDRALLLDFGPHAAARLTIVGDPKAGLNLLQGSHEPFGGWVVRKGIPVAAPAVVVSQPERRSIVVSVFEVGAGQSLRQRPLPEFTPGPDSEDWQISLELSDGRVETEWNGRNLTLRFANGTTTRAEINADTAAAEARRRATVDAYAAMADRYPRFRELTDYRYKVTYVAIFLLLMQELVVLAVRRIAPRAAPPLRMMAAVSWLAFGLFASLVYLR